MASHFTSPPESITHVFFDLGSTLLDETEMVRVRIERTVERLQGRGKAYLAEEIWRRMAEAARYTPHPYTTVMRDIDQTVWEPWPDGPEGLYPGTLPVLEWFYPRYSLGVIANQSLGTEERLNNYGILKYFDVVASSAELCVEKPDPRIFEWALEQAQCRPTNAVMVGDRIDNDIIPAKALGMATVWVRQGWGGMTQQIPPEGPDVVVESIADLLNEWYRIDRGGHSTKDSAHNT